MGIYKPVPVTVAMAIADDLEKSMVVILAYDPEHQLTHTTTYGVSAEDKEQAAAIGQLCAETIGSDLSRRQTYEDFHENLDPALLTEAKEILLAISRRQGTTPQMLQRVERWCKAADHGMRQG